MRRSARLRLLIAIVFVASFLYNDNNVLTTLEHYKQEDYCPRCLPCPELPPRLADKKPQNGCNRCVNRVVVNHKMGWIMTRDILDKHFANQTNIAGSFHIMSKESHWPASHASRWYENSALLRNVHRDVVVTRNFVDAFVSGYLFHKSGKECNPHAFQRNCVEQNIQNCTHHSSSIWHTILKRPENGDIVERIPQDQRATLCQFLKRSDTRLGMQIYMDYATQTWYHPHVDYYRQIQGTNVALSICYDDLNNHHKKPETLVRIKQWLSNDIGDNAPKFPNDSRPLASTCGRIPKENFATWRNEMIAAVSKESEKYTGDHATNHDKSLRSELKAIIRELDSSLYNDFAAESNRLFGCEESEWRNDAKVLTDEASGLSRCGNCNYQIIPLSRTTKWLCRIPTVRIVE